MNIYTGGCYVLKGQPVVVNQVIANVSSLAPNSLLAGRTALITGGTSGIGYAIARAFVNSGAFVVITSRSDDRLKVAVDNLVSETHKDHSILGFKLDNSMVDEFEPSLDRMLILLGKRNIDILVNNAGCLNGWIGNTSEEEYDKVMDTNLKGCFFMTKVLGKYMKDKGIQGNILNVASSSSLRPAVSAYTLSKWGIRGLTLGTAKLLAPFGITVNGIAPGPTATPMLSKTEDNLYLEKSPIGRYALASEIADMSVVLVSGLGRTIVGDIVYMTGGAGLITFDDCDYTF